MAVRNGDCARCWGSRDESGRDGPALSLLLLNRPSKNRGSTIVSTSGPQLPEQPVLSPTQCSGDGPLSLPGPGGGHECEGRDEVRQWGLFC